MLPSARMEYETVKKNFLKGGLERMLLLTVAVAYTGYLVEEAMRLRAARLCSLAAGESPYERTHPKPRLVKKS